MASFTSSCSFFVRAFEVDHAGHTCLGYLIGSQTTSGLKKEYQHLDGLSLRDLVKSSVKIQGEPIETIEVAYTGDTCANGLVLAQLTEPNDGAEAMAEKCSTAVTNDGQTTYQQLLTTTQTAALYRKQIFQAELLLCELTFLDSSKKECDRSMASERGHLHICELECIFSSHELFQSQPLLPETETAVTSSFSSSGEQLTTETTTTKSSIVFFHSSGRFDCGGSSAVYSRSMPGPKKRRTCQIMTLLEG